MLPAPVIRFVLAADIVHTSQSIIPNSALSVVKFCILLFTIFSQIEVHDDVIMDIGKRILRIH